MKPFKDLEVYALTAMQARETIEAYEMAAKGLDLSTFITPRQPLRMTESGVAVIDVKGSLTSKAPPIHEITGNTTYETLHNEISAATDAGAHTILFNIDSGGGSVMGLPEISGRIGDLDAQTIAYTQGGMLSAAYHIGAAADVVLAAPSALVGSIGSIMTVKQGEGDDGVVVMTSDGADLKGSFSGELTETQAEFLQSNVDKAGEEFKIHVNANRNVNAEVFRAGFYSGNEQIELGLVDDQVDTLTNLLTEIS